MTNPTTATMPPWLKRGIPAGGRKGAVERHLAAQGLHTVCLEAGCPNRAECFGRGTATFLILGDRCTRSCSFCAIAHGAPAPVDDGEPLRVAQAVKDMGLRYAVITSVTRDDLADGGAGHFARTVGAIRETDSQIMIEVLIPDFKGNDAALAEVVESGPDVLNHNVETVPRLYGAIRPQAAYRQSLQVLENARAMDPSMKTKSGIMVGLGETREEVVNVLSDLRGAGCVMVTIGQYLRPSKNQAPVQEYVTPEQFGEYRAAALSLGFAQAPAGPFVRSSYRAEELLTIFN